MKPRFALELSNEAVSLIERQADGWAVLGTVNPEDQRLDRKLALLRSKAEAAAPEGFFTKLILPNSQILYLTVTAPGPDAQTRRSQIRKGLEGRTPYPADDLVFDWSGSGPEVRVAVVARVTLDEAQDFAEAYGFRPAAFVAAPDEGRFAGEPFFGQTIMAARHLPVGQRYDRDQDPVRLASARPDADAAEEPEAEDQPTPVEEAPFVEVEVSDEAPTEAEAQGDKPMPEPDEAGDATEAEPDDLLPSEDSELIPAPAAEAEAAEPEGEPEAAAVEMAPVVDEAPFVELIEAVPEDMPEELPETAPDSATEMADDAATSPDDDGRIAAPLVTAAGISEAAEPVLPPVVEDTLTEPVSAFQSRRSQGPSVDVQEDSRLTALVSRIGPAGAKRPAMTESALPEALPRTAERAAAPRAPIREARKVRGIGLRVAAAGALIVAALGLWSLWPAGEAPTTETTSVAEAVAPATKPSPTAPPAPAPAPQGTPPVDSTAPAEKPVPDLVQPAVAGSAPTTMALAEPDAAATEPPAAGADLAPDGLTEEPALAGGPALDAPPPSQPLPQPFGTTFTYDSDGQITPTAEGVITPGGFTLILGKPGTAPPHRPATVAAAALAAAAAAALPPVNEKPSVRRPAARSAKLAAAAAAAPPVAAISAKAPKPRPAKIAEAARQAEENATRIADAAAAAAAAEARAAGVDDASVQAALAEAQAQPEAAPEPAAPAPQAKPAEPPPEEVDEPELQGGIANMPTTRTVAKKSTFANAIDLGSINLIGIYGTSSNRRALVRLSSGRYVKVQVGDRLDGGQVAAIGDNVLSYVKKGRTITLKLAKDS